MLALSMDPLPTFAVLGTLAFATACRPEALRGGEGHPAGRSASPIEPVGDRSAGSETPRVAQAEPEGVGEADACDARRAEFDGRAEQSRARACESDSECASICGARGMCPEENVVVHVTDARELAALADDILAACGSFYVGDPAAGYTEVEAECVEHRCRALRSSVAPYDGES